VFNFVLDYRLTPSKDTVAVNMKTWQQQELDDLRLQIRSLIAGIEVALKKALLSNSFGFLPT
jgi:hypothetical protein